MSKQKLVIQHDLSKMSAEQLTQYLRDVSEFIGLDPDLSALDTIWMDNESGPGKSLVIYARRGTAEILRRNLGINVDSLTDKMVKGSIVFTATGKNKEGRQEIATGSKFIDNLSGKGLDDGIMTASTRATRRLTMQFTSLGILDESEVRATVGDLSNPASQATLSGSPMVIPPTPTVANNAPGKLVETGKVTHEDRFAQELTDFATVTSVQAAQNEFVAQQEALRKNAAAFLNARDEGAVQSSLAPPAASVTEIIEASTLPKRARRQKNTVSMDVEPETVSSPAPAAVPTQAVVAAPPQALDVAPQPAPVPPVATPAALMGTEFQGKPTDAQMADYRKRVSVFTSQLPSSENLGSVQKMRAFLTKQTGTTPQDMQVHQWEDMLSWFDSFVSQHTVKGLVLHINNSLGVK
jgi:hypothetical protein